jgi:hypothetical protein
MLGLVLIRGRIVCPCQNGQVTQPTNLEIEDQLVEANDMVKKEYIVDVPVEDEK